MDILNNFWELMTTENEMVTKVMTTCTMFLEAWLILKLFTSVLKLEYTKKQAIFYILLSSLFSLIFKFCIPSPFNTFCNYILMFVLIKKIFNLNVIQALLSLIIPTSIFALLGIFILKPILLIFDISVKQAANTPIYEIIYLVILYGIILIFIKLLKTINLSHAYYKNFSPHNKGVMITNFLLGFFTLSVQLTVTAFYTDKLPFAITFLNFISLLAYFFISLYSLTRAMKLQITQLELENAENYNKTLSILYDNVKAFKHDFDNMVFTIGGFINTNDMIGLKSYYESLENECQSLNNIALLNPTLINNPGIYSLLTAKYKKAKEQNVEIQLDFFFDFSKLHMPIYEFSRMLGIFLDNAIEAASASNEKIIKIMFRDSSKSCVQIIQIENSYVNKSVDTKLIFEKGVTEKENHQGMGLWEVKKILKHNNNINLITEINGTFFKQCLEIYY